MLGGKFVHYPEIHMATIRILFLGDIVGEPGRKAVINQLPILKQTESLDFIIVNGENSAGGKGITPKIAIDLLRAGAAVITTLQGRIEGWRLAIVVLTLFTFLSLVR